jgi:hypothetical protein
LKFRRLLEANRLTEAIFGQIDAHLRTAVFADAGDTGAPKREEIVEAVAAGKLRADID